MFRSTLLGIAAALLLAPAAAVYAQSHYERGGAALTVEAFGNLTAGAWSGESIAGDPSADNWRFDGAVRLLGRWHRRDAADVGARVVVQSSPENRLELGEASVLLFGGAGRLEIGDRMGLPDVLTGYAPNNFEFTSAEFGPASGRSLDPRGGLQTAFLDRGLAAQVSALASLGSGASLSDDQSGKILYVSPKSHGFLGGISYAPDATDPRYRGLTQLGLTHETYWKENVLHWGGSYTYARGNSRTPGGPIRDLHSLNLGVNATLNDALTLGISATFNGNSGLPRESGSASRSNAWGAVVSVNYNTGPWTWGAYYQLSRAEGELTRLGDDQLRAFEAGASYRWNTHWRAYVAWFHYHFDDEGGVQASDRYRGDVLLAGLRFAL